MDQSLAPEVHPSNCWIFSRCKNSSRTTRSRFLESLSLPNKAVQLQLSLGTLRREPATRLFYQSLDPKPRFNGKKSACQYRHEAPPEFPLTLLFASTVHHLSGSNTFALDQNTRSNRSCAPSSTRQVELRRLVAGTHDVQGGNSRLLVESSILHCDEERCGAHGDQGPWRACTSLATVAENITVCRPMRLLTVM